LTTSRGFARPPPNALRPAGDLPRKQGTTLRAIAEVASVTHHTVRETAGETPLADEEN